MKSENKFEINGHIYHSFPTLEVCIKEAGISNANRTKKILNLFEREAIVDVSQLFSYSTYDLIGLGINKKFATILTRHLQILRRRGPIMLKAREVLENEKLFSYLNTGNSQIDHILTYANTKTGLRSKTLVEVYGAAGIGKSQFMMTMAAMCIRNNPGWDRSVLYIDSEGSFDINRFYQIAAFYDISIKEVDEKLLVARAYNFDEIDTILDNIAVELRTRDLGMIILDSIIDPLKTQYPLDDDLSNLQERQQHLKQVTDRLKSLAQMHNLIALISNQIRSAMDEHDPNKVVPQGGNVLAHATDMRFFLHEVKHQDKVGWMENIKKIEDTGIQISTLELIDCGFLPQGRADLLIGPFGTADPTHWKELVEQVQQQDHLSINKTSISGKSTEYLEQLQDQLYG